MSIHVFFGNTEELINIVNCVCPDIIFHLASLFIAEHKYDQINDLIQSNVFFSTQLLEAACNAGVKYFINTGTHWQNYNTDDYCPSDLYAATKQAFQSIAAYYISNFDIRFVTLKLLDTYGPFDPRKKVMAILKKTAVSGEKIEMSGGEQELAFLYIDDVVRAFLLAAQYAYKMPPYTEKVFMALPSEIYNLKEIVEIFQRAFKCKLNVDFGKRPYRKREVMKICCTDENILSNVKTVRLYDGLKKIFEAEK